MILLENFQIATRNSHLRVERFQELPKTQRAEVEDLIVRLQIEENNHKSEKTSSKNSYESKANVIEDSKRKASISKGLKQKKTA